MSSTALHQDHSAREKIEEVIMSPVPESLPNPRIAEETSAREIESTTAVSPSAPLYSIFSTRHKHFIIFMVAFAGFFSPLSSAIYFPILPILAKDLSVSINLINLTLTSFMLFQGLAPTVFGDLADMAGRRPAYVLALVTYEAANIGLALQHNYAALFLLRCLQSTGSSGTIALANGVVADISTTGERGRYMGFAAAGAMLGPSLGPLIGGLLSQFLGWRAVFWFLTIVSGLCLVLFLIVLPETGRNVVGNGSILPPIWNMSLLNYLRLRRLDKDLELAHTISRQEQQAARVDLARKRKLRWPNPLKTIYIVIEKDCAAVLFSNALIYTAFYCVLASMPSLFKDIYRFNELQIGLCYLPFGVGAATASVGSGFLLDKRYKAIATSLGITVDRKRGNDLKNFPIEKARLQVAFPPLILGSCCILCYGWVLQQRVSLVGPLVLQFIVGICFTGCFTCLSTLLVDLYPLSPATATAANNLVRCVLGAGGTAVINPMIQGMGLGWSFTFIGLMLIATSPLLWVEMKWGPRWREARNSKVDKKEEKGKTDIALKGSDGMILESRKV